MKPVVFDSEANDEFRVAAAYYEAQRPGRGSASSTVSRTTSSSWSWTTESGSPP
jgi:hypothetical protein